METTTKTDRTHCLVDRPDLVRILDEQFALMGIKYDPTVTAEQVRAMSRADIVDPGPLFTVERQEIVYRYSGPIYNSPAGRGIWLYGFEPERMLEDELPSGEYIAEIVVRLTPKPAPPQP